MNRRVVADQNRKNKVKLTASIAKEREAGYSGYGLVDNLIALVACSEATRPKYEPKLWF